MKPTISIPPRKITTILVIVVLGLALLGLLETYVEFFVGHESVPGTEAIVELFDMIGEDTVPGWFSVVALFSCSLLLAAIAFEKKKERAPYATHWVLLSVIFLALSLDEGAGFHEVISPPLKAALGTSGPLYYAWVIPAGIFVLVFALAYFGFLLKLPRETKRLVIIAAGLYVGGALGMEILAGQYRTLHGKDITYNLIKNAEELMEMTGIVVFLYSLMSYIRDHVGGVALGFSDRPSQGEASESFADAPQPTPEEKRPPSQVA